MKGWTSGVRDRPAAARPRFLTAERKLLAAWFVFGMLPFALQTRSYVRFVKPHEVSPSLVVPSELPKQTANLTTLCPVTAFVLAGIWCNFEATHYYRADQGIVCHAVMPQFNLHGNYFMGSSKVTPYPTTPSSCADDSLAFEQYLYHGSIGYYSYYEGEVGTYCTKDNTAYITVEVMGTYDINGAHLAADTGSTNTRISYWYIIVGVVWLVYRALTIRRSCVLCRRYGRRIQYASLGYNLSGFMLLVFEILENTKLLKEKWRLRIKRTFFSYETALVGELAIALVF
ncbi:hypothetical protein PR001_g3300 [Phytophthora rubi]|uniref:Uncharacterized protein n=1 Tax=Phytophthora rubi TaxID=129364 RepID=A0A6A3P685_9STRA|nr:hypothetical protein PR001_g3300 [Phytophthora rubi]